MTPSHVQDRHEGRAFSVGARLVVSSGAALPRGVASVVGAAGDHAALIRPDIVYASISRADNGFEQQARMKPSSIS